MRPNLSTSESEHLYIYAIPMAASSLLETRFKHGAAHFGADRWHLVCRLLANPERESTRLAALLERLPAEVRRHELADDVKRRYWTRHG